MIKRAYQYRFYPTPQQAHNLACTFGCSRFVYNWALKLRKTAYFQETSHGFRPNRSCHTALREIRNTWTGANWLLEGDIQACCDELDHGVLVPLLRKKIKAERFLNLIWKLLRAGYLNLQEERKDSLAGTPQGGLASPILAKVYLHERDEKMEEIGKREQRGKRKSESLPYKRNRKQIPVCKGCHRKIQRGEYDEMRLSDLAYNPYASEKRK